MFSNDRFPLIPGPTPLAEASHLRRILGGPRILIKRDDLTGRIVGGNKIRKLEYLLADARRAGATHVVTGGGAQSNHAAQTAVCARMAGLEAVLVLSRPTPGRPCGNLLVHRLLGITPEYVDRYEPDDLEQAMRQCGERLTREGFRPYHIPLGGSTPIGIRGYVDCWHEIANQCRTLGVSPAAIYSATGTGGTLAGLLLGHLEAPAPCRLVGVDVGAIPGEGPLPRAVALVADARGGPCPTLPVELNRHQIGPGYARPGPDCLTAMRLFLQTEGLLLDPAYTGKAAAALVADIGAGRWRRDETVVFIHTGGAAGFFTEGMAAHLDNSPA
ncbi:MAG TPA: pyridoxal-phosphate dependent enzyme [Acidobacteriota bacterium]|nr:pyridoxal-phosphate dependent enzyme [Acidobacteriota bacterium]HQG92337.1 pyridoxal-phosphate dependent enzyme [Acidobacteriota bacterium]HQK86672.1 pyridoxal-phosphate dependent enzyme [Acidobacteriota bacterium]